MINDFLNIGHIVGEYGQDKFQEMVEISAVSRRGIEPRKFEKEEINEFSVMIFVHNFRYRCGKDFDPYGEGLCIARCVHKALSVYNFIELFELALYSMSIIFREKPYISLCFERIDENFSL